MENRGIYRALRIGVAALALVALLALGGCGSGGGGQAEAGGAAELASSPPRAGFTALQTRKCRTELPPSVPQPAIAPTTQVSIPASVAGGLVAYRDAAGTTLIGPGGWECEAGIGSDGSERINAFPPGHEDPAEPPFRPGQVVSLQLYPTCQRCIAEYACALFPAAKPVKRLGTAGGPQCPADGLPERVTHPSPTTALFFDRPGAEGTGTGSGGSAPSFGAMSYTEASGMRKVSCTLPSRQADVCAGIVAATMLSAPL